MENIFPLIASPLMLMALIHAQLHSRKPDACRRHGCRLVLLGARALESIGAPNGKELSNGQAFSPVVPSFHYRRAGSPTFVHNSWQISHLPLSQQEVTV